MPVTALCQLSGERAALHNMEKGKWDKAYEQLHKLVRKDSLQPVAQFILAQYFFTPRNPAFHIDSAYQAITKATHDFHLATVRQRERAKRYEVDSLALIAYREKIDSGAFARAGKQNTTAAYDFFLQHYTLASQRQQAVELRDEVAFLDAVKENSYEAFQEYLSLYPASKRLGDARYNYEKLLYETKTDDQRLASYETFLKEFPETPYRDDAEEHILNISTASGDPETFQDFLAHYPKSCHVALVEKIVFHLLAEDTNTKWSDVSLNDSSRQLLELNEHYLVPFLHAEHFGFMDNAGTEIIKPNITEIDKIYRCGNIMEDVLVVPDGIINRLGTFIYRGNVLELEDLGSGFLLIEGEECSHILHKSGYMPLDTCVEDARVLNGAMLALKREGKWGVITFTGLTLQPFTWDDIHVVGSIVVLKRGDKLFPLTIKALSMAADQQPPSLQDSFDELKLWPGNLIWAKSGAYQGVLDSNLEFYLPFERHAIAPAFFGYTAVQEGRTKIFSGKESKGSFRQAIVNQPWLAVTAQGGWQLSKPLEPKFKTIMADSAFFVGPFAITVNTDTLTAFVDGGKKIVVKQPVRFEFIQGADSTSYLSLEQDSKRTVFNQKGKKLFTLEADKIQHAGETIFIFHKKEKKGLVGPDGKVLLPPEYDAIGQLKDGTLSLLKAMKFGLYHVRTKKLIKPEYNKNLIVYNPTAVVAFKDGAYAFIDWQNKPTGEGGFAEVRTWNDTIALVRKNAQWMMYRVSDGKVSMDKIRNFKVIRDLPNDKLFIVQQENRYGVIHNKKGIVIPITFSDIVNVGPAEDPLYFTEKHVEEASIFVVIYYNSQGKMLRKEVYEQDDYERIYCAGKK